MKLASLFDGIAGFPLAASRAEIETVWSAEIDAQCRSVSRRHFPGTFQITDVIAARAMLERKSRGRFATQLVRPDIICGGFPCQDLSVAGKRAGLAGSRSGLWFVFRRILGIVRPRWVCIENVPGLLSSNEGRDMRVIADALGQLGYGWAFRVLDAQWFGVPQRRRRVFIVGCFGDRRRAAEVLFESNSLPWDSPPRREARARTADCLTAGVAASHGVNRPGRRREDDTNLVTHTLHEGAPAIAFSIQERAVSENLANGPQGKGYQEGIAYTLEARSNVQATASRYGVRRLTPRECERLQGFPDDWTRYGHDGRELSDSARYRMLGNAIAVPCVEWFMRRIMESYQ